MISVDPGQSSSYFPLRINQSQSQSTNPIVPIKFPSTRNVLWESKPVGEYETLALILDSQVVHLFIVEKCLRLAHRYAEDRSLTSFLLGSVYPKSGDSGICFEVDRFDPGREITEKRGENVCKSKVPTAVVPGDHVIPITVKQDLLTSDDSISHTKREFRRAIQVMESKICGKDVLTLSHVVSLKANLYCRRELDELIINLHCGGIIPDSKFQARLIAPLPIIQTTLARNLAGPLRLSDVEGTPKMGYVTMDQTRKLLLLLESDTKVYNLPLIGIWISGVHNVHHPYVWASCLRYLNCHEIKDRVLHSTGTFLLLHYSIAQKIPDFWECFSDNNETLSFELVNCQETLHLDLDDYSSKEPLCFYLTPATTEMNNVLFDEAMAEWKKQRNSSRELKQNLDVDQNDSFSKSSGSKHDENPRPSLSPHPSPTQVKTPNAPAPEESLSLSFDEGSNNFVKNKHEISREKTLPPRFKQTPMDPKKPAMNKSKNMKIHRQPFKQVTPQYQGSSPNTFTNRGKSGLVTSNQVSRKEENKENTPLTSRNIPQSNINRKSRSASTGNNTGDYLSEKMNDINFVDNKQEETLTKVIQTGQRKSYHNENYQPYQVQQTEGLHRARSTSHSSLSLSDDDNLSDVSTTFTTNNDVSPLHNNQTPTDRIQYNQPLINNRERLPVRRDSKQLECRSNFHHVSAKPVKGDSCTLKRPSHRSYVQNQSNGCYVQTSPTVSNNMQEPLPSPQNNTHLERQCCNEGNSQSTNHDINQCTRITSDYNAEKQSVCNKRSESFNHDTDQNLSCLDIQKARPKFSSNHEMHTIPKQFVKCPTFQQSDNLQQVSMSPKCSNVANLGNVVDINTQACQTKNDAVVSLAGGPISNTNSQLSPNTCMKNNSEFSKQCNDRQNTSVKRPSSASFVLRNQYNQDSENPVQSQSQNISNSTEQPVSSNHVSNDFPQQPFNYQASHNAAAEITLHPSGSEIAKQKTEEKTAVGGKLRKEEKLPVNKELEEKLKRQEDMIKVLQEQVRSLLRMQECVSSDKEVHSFPLTPASTPVPSHENGENLSCKRSPQMQEKQSISPASDVKYESKQVTIGVNTGASLLWNRPQEECCECKRSQAQQIQLDDQDNCEEQEHPEVFLTPDKTESLRSPSQHVVQADSTSCSSSPNISGLVMSSMSVDGASLSNNQVISTSQKEESTETNVSVKEQQFYDKLLCQVKDLLSEQVNTQQQEDEQHTSERNNVPTREVVVQATIKQLDKIKSVKNSEQDECQQSSSRFEEESSRVLSTQQRSLSTSFIPEHPRLNYVSMLVDDTFDEVTYIDEVALKYLTDEEIKQFKTQLPSSTAAVKRSFTRTVRFGSLPSDNEHRSPSRRNIREVDFTWNNLSFCTKNYLTKYNLVEGRVSYSDKQLSNLSKKENSPEHSIEPCKPPFPSPVPQHSQESSHILDIQRLKNLPKLF